MVVSPRFSVVGKNHHHLESRGTWLIRRPLEGESALADIALILGGIVRDSHRLMYYI